VGPRDLSKISDLVKQISAALLRYGKAVINEIDRRNGLPKVLVRSGEIVDLLLCASEAARGQSTLTVEVSEGLQTSPRQRLLGKAPQGALRVVQLALVEEADDVGDGARRRSSRTFGECRGDLLGFLDGQGTLARRREEADDKYQGETGRGVRSGPRYHGGPSVVTVPMRAKRFGDRTVEEVSRAVNHRWGV
jgi:hypothetical protein